MKNINIIYCILILSLCVTIDRDSRRVCVWVDSLLFSSGDANKEIKPCQRQYQIQFKYNKMELSFLFMLFIYSYWTEKYCLYEITSYNASITLFIREYYEYLAYTRLLTIEIPDGNHLFILKYFNYYSYSLYSVVLILPCTLLIESHWNW